MPLRISRLFVYPVKSCRGIPVATAEVTRLGLRYDRQWMFIDEHGMFVAQRGARGLGVAVSTTCLIDTALADGQMTLRAPNMPPLHLPQDGVIGNSIAVRIWDSHTSGIDQGVDAAAWATQYLSRQRPGRYRLVRMDDDDAHRPSKLGNGALAYGDAYPFMMMSEETLVDLNGRMSEPLPIDRFRPNVVIAGGAAYVEDSLDRLHIGDVEFTGMTRCVRCPIPATDQRTTKLGKEPLRTLATYRRQDDGVVLGRNYNHHGCGWIRVGDQIVCAD